MISVAIIGKGNVGFHLYHELNKSEDLNVAQFNSREQQSLENFDVAIIAVSDDAIAEVSRHVKTSLVVHTSGTTAMKALQNTTRKGVFYPLQSFSKEKVIDFEKLPICIEAENENDLKLLETLVNRLKSDYFEIDSEKRKYIHVAAVFVNNFVNHMYSSAWDIFEEHNVPFNILMPLIKETVEKISGLAPTEAQTGPAIRNDEKTIKNHLTLLNESQQELYKTITKSIQQHGKKL